MLTFVLILYYSSICSQLLRSDFAATLFPHLVIISVEDQLQQHLRFLRRRERRLLTVCTHRCVGDRYRTQADRDDESTGGAALCAREWVSGGCACGLW